MTSGKDSQTMNTVILTKVSRNGDSPDDGSNFVNQMGISVESDFAIEFRSASKHYKSSNKKTPVLVGLTMKVMKGQIYGLLGPSGCGKTTLLKCIVGKLKLDEGTVVVFGETPGSGSSHGVPGSRVGYMPQDIALFGEFNIKETLMYFARIFGMTENKFKDRLDFLTKFLEFPSQSQSLETMSGGQQRRASLAVALLHEPELLILDEPTVGVDPLLRQSIWSHLLDLSSNGKYNGAGRTTIVVTTHYIEEARQAHRVGMMRLGRLLAEGHPYELLDRYQSATLEDAFLELCLRDGDHEMTKFEDHQPKTSLVKKTTGDDADESYSPQDQKVLFAPKDCSSIPAAHSRHSVSACKDPLPVKAKRMKACMMKTFNRMKKRWGFLLYQFALPALQVSLFCMAIGQDPKELPFAVVNLENDGSSCPMNVTQECPFTRGSLGIPQPNSNLANFTCRFLSFVDRKVISPIYFENETMALEAVENGFAWGFVVMQKNFSRNLYNRAIQLDFENLDTEILERSTIRVRLDVTNQHISYTLQLKLVEAFESFMKQLVHSCDLRKELTSLPLRFDPPIYGSKDLTFTDFMAPGIILTIIHSMALGYSAMIIIMERNEGMLDRTWVAGVTSGEFALSHFLVSVIVNFLQVIVTLVFMILVFEVPTEGSICLVVLLTMLQGISGTTIGLIISAVCQTQQDATQIALGIFYPNLILSGIIWPIESMPVILRYLSYALPQTFACEAMRGILLRGWGLEYFPVWRGFTVTLAWIIASYFIFRKLVKIQE